MKLKVFNFLILLAVSGVLLANTDLHYRDSLLPQDDYAADMTPPNVILGHAIGRKAASPEMVLKAVSIWAEQSSRVELVEYARSHEGRPLVYLVISAPENLKRLEQIKENMARLHNPHDLDDASAKKIIAETPAIAWMAYSIHGNESSGTDASMAVTYYLAASKSPDVERLLQDLVVIVDPSMNPDGRSRFIKQIEQHNASLPNVDYRDLTHTGYWPSGRVNHYWFDLNRDFILGVHPETRGRVTHINQWNPIFMVDAHEQGALSNYLFSPPREPVNKNTHPSRLHWNDVFAREQSKAFDERQWPYFNGEWFEDLYPGYSSYSQFRGATHILYEQPRLHDDGIRKPDGRLVTYMQSVDHQFTSTIVNLETLMNNREAMLRDYLAEKRETISEKGPFAGYSYVIPVSENRDRMKAFVSLMQWQGFEIYQAAKAIAGKSSKDSLGREHRNIRFAKGSLVIPARQADARLLKALLEFDVKIDDEVLRKEREGIIRNGESIMYDVTAWNLAMMYGLELHRVETVFGKSELSEVDLAPKEPVLDDNAIAYFAKGADDASLKLAASAMAAGIQVHLATEAGKLGDKEFDRGALFFTDFANGSKDKWQQKLIRLAHRAQAELHPVTTGFGEHDLPDLGGGRMVLLAQPRVALATRGHSSAYNAGAIWHTLDKRYSIPVSQINEDQLSSIDLRAYNVLILPGRWGSSLPVGTNKAIEAWVRQGGTLIAVADGARQLLDKENGISAVRLIEDALEKPEAFQDALYRDWLLEEDVLPAKNVLASGQVLPIEYPWQVDTETKHNADTAKRKNNWSSAFMPQGAFVNSSQLPEHWLSSGIDDQLPILVSDQPVLLSPASVEAVVRLGKLENDDNSDKPLPLLWASVPPGKKMNMRLSGLLWPEAAHRMAGSAWLTRESIGRGQMILFAGTPVFRGSALGTMRYLMNAVILGPGAGANAGLIP